MSRTFSLIVVLLLIGVSTIGAETSTQPYNALTLEHDGEERLAHLYAPDSDAEAAIIALHPMFSSGRAMEALSGLNAVAEARQWVVAYPESLQPYWDDGRTTVDLPPDNGAVDDAGYLVALADSLREQYDIERVYLTGFALGGTMAIRAACDYPQAFDGLAVVGASMWAYQVTNCDQTQVSSAMDVLFIKGTADHIYWDVGRPIGNNPDWTILSSEALVTYWLDRYACDAPAQTDVTNSNLLVAANCMNGHQVAYLPILNVGNYWPRGEDGALNQTGIDSAEIIGGFFGADDDAWQADTLQTAIPTDNPRSYTLYVPTSYDPIAPTPIVVSLHGRGANNISQALSSGWNEVAEEHGFIVLYPQAYDRNYNDPQQADAVWNYNDGVPFFPTLGWNDDEAIDKMVDELGGIFNVDMNRLYVNGLSNGGYMTHRLACTRADRYAAFATMAANAPFGLTELCDEGNHAPILIYHGTADTISPWRGATSNVRGFDDAIYVLAPIPNTVAFWVAQNECDPAFSETDLPNEDVNSRVIQIQYGDCPTDSAVELYAVVGGGHVWHGVNDVQNNFLGEDNMDINASEVIWDFYQQFTLDGRTDDAESALDLPEVERSGFGLPDVPLVLEGTADETDDSPEGQVISLLRQGELAIYFAIDLSEPVNCDTYELPTELVTLFEDNVTAFDVMGVSIARVIAEVDCRTFELARMFDPDNVIPVFNNESEMPVVLNAIPTPRTLHIIVGSVEEISNRIGQDVPANHSVLLEPSGTSTRAIAIVPPNGWIALVRD